MNEDVVNMTERPEDTARRFARRLGRVEELHALRRFDGDGFTVMRCRECGWNWPCPTTHAISAAYDE